MQVNSVTNPTGTADLSAVTQKAMDKNAFLNLLVTQLRYQDPMSPMEDKEFVSQLAQFSQLEQMQQLNTGFEGYGKSATANQAFSMTGKWIDYTDPATGSTFTGRVDSVSFHDGQPKLMIGSTAIGLDAVERVYPDVGSFSKGKLSSQAFDMIGKTVDYVDNATGVAESGAVDSVSFADGWPVLNIGTKVVDARNVIRLHEGSPSTGTNDAIDQANAMLGHKISYVDPVTKEVKEGKVDSVSVNNSLPWLHIGQSLIDPAQVAKVF